MSRQALIAPIAHDALCDQRNNRRMESKPFSPSWFEDQFARTGKGQADLYRALAAKLPDHKTDRTKVNKMLMGKRQPQAREIPLIWAFFNLDSGMLAEALRGEELSPEPEPDDIASIGSETGVQGIPDGSVPQLDVTGGMGAGGLTIVREGVPNRKGMTFAAEHVRDYWRLPEDLIRGLGLRTTDIVIIPVQGDSMSDTLTEGDYVLIDTRHRLPSPDGVYALGDEFGGIVVKRLEVTGGRSDDEAIVRIISDNPRHAPKERPLSELRIIGRVLRKFGVVG